MFAVPVLTIGTNELIAMSSVLDEPYVLLRSTSDQPIKLQANDVPGLYDSVFEYRESLFVQLREAYEAGDQTALSELWKSASRSR